MDISHVAVRLGHRRHGVLPIKGVRGVRRAIRLRVARRPSLESSGSAVGSGFRLHIRSEER